MAADPSSPAAGPAARAGPAPIRRHAPPCPLKGSSHATRPPGITQPPWSYRVPGPRRRDRLRDRRRIPFARSLTPLPTNRSSVSFPQLDPDDPEWVAELGEIPALTAEPSEYEVAVSKLAGTILISREVDRRHRFPGHQQTEQILRDTF